MESLPINAQKSFRFYMKSLKENIDSVVDSVVGLERLYAVPLEVQIN